MGTEAGVTLASAAAARLAPHAAATRRAPGPRPLQSGSCSDSGGAAGIQTAAAAIFPGASSCGTRRGHRGAGREADPPGPEAGQGSAGGRHLNEGQSVRAWASKSNE